MINLNIFKKIDSLLTLKERKRSRVLLIMMVISMFLEAIGIGIIAPLMAILNDTKIMHKYPIILDIMNLFGLKNHNSFFVFCVIIVALIYVIKAIYLTIFYNSQMNFVYGIKQRISELLYNKYLKKDYSYHVNNNSSSMIRNVTGEIDLFIDTNLISSFTFIAESLVMIAVVSLLLYVETIGTLVAFVVVTLYVLVFNKMFKRKINELGNKRQINEKMRMQEVQQGLGGVKEIIILDKADFFLNRFRKYNKASCEVSERYFALQYMPKIWLEFLAIFSLLVIIFILVLYNRSNTEIISILALFGLASYRLIPSTIRVMNSSHSIGYGEATLDMIIKETVTSDVTLKKNNPEVNFDKENLSLTIEMQDVSYKYDDTDKLILNHIDLNIPFGVSIGIKGSSGAGKSTLVDLLLGIKHPVQGKILVNNIDIETAMPEWQKYIGYVSQSIYLIDDTIIANVAFGIPSNEINEEEVLEAIKLAQIEEYINSLPNGLYTEVGELGGRMSGGQRQRIGIARAFYRKAKVLLLDEATSSLDAETERQFIESLKFFKGKITTIVVAHKDSVFKYCDQVIEIKEGRIQKSYD